MVSRRLWIPRDELRADREGQAQKMLADAFKGVRDAAGTARDQAADYMKEDRLGWAQKQLEATFAPLRQPPPVEPPPPPEPPEPPRPPSLVSDRPVPGVDIPEQPSRLSEVDDPEQNPLRRMVGDAFKSVRERAETQMEQAPLEFTGVRPEDFKPGNLAAKEGLFGEEGFLQKSLGTNKPGEQTLTGGLADQLARPIGGLAGGRGAVRTGRDWLQSIENIGVGRDKVLKERNLSGLADIGLGAVGAVAPQFNYIGNVAAEAAKLNGVDDETAEAIGATVGFVTPGGGLEQVGKAGRFIAGAKGAESALGRAGGLAERAAVTSGNLAPLREGEKGLGAFRALAPAAAMGVAAPIGGYLGGREAAERDGNVAAGVLGGAMRAADITGGVSDMGLGAVSGLRNLSRNLPQRFAAAREAATAVDGRAERIVPREIAENLDIGTTERGPSFGIEGYREDGGPEGEMPDRFRTALGKVGGDIDPTTGAIQVDLSRWQRGTLPGLRSMRGGVFYSAGLADPNSRYAKQADTGSVGGSHSLEGPTTFLRPFVVNGEVQAALPELMQLWGRATKYPGGARDLQRKAERIQFEIDNLSADPARKRFGGQDWGRFQTKPWSPDPRYGGTRAPQAPSPKRDAQRTDQYARLLRQAGLPPRAAQQTAEDVVAHAANGLEELTAIRESVVGHLARESGHDGVIGLDRDKTGRPILLEVMDNREELYPGFAGQYGLHGKYREPSGKPILREDADPEVRAGLDEAEAVTPESAQRLGIVADGVAAGRRDGRGPSRALQVDAAGELIGGLAGAQIAGAQLTEEDDPFLKKAAAGALGFAAGSQVGGKARRNLGTLQRAARAFQTGEAETPGARERMIPPAVARGLALNEQPMDFEAGRKSGFMPNRMDIAHSIRNTEGARLFPDGTLELQLYRASKPKNELRATGRGGVFYGATREHVESGYLKTGSGANTAAEGGQAMYEGPTAYRNVLFVDETGSMGRDIASAFLGKRRQEQIERDLTEAISRQTPEGRQAAITQFQELGWSPDEAVRITDALVDQYGRYSTDFALNESIASGLLRSRGYEAAIGINRAGSGRGGRIGEVFDVREAAYPGKGPEDYRVEPEFTGAQPRSLVPGRPVDPVLKQIARAEQEGRIPKGMDRRESEYGNAMLDHLGLRQDEYGEPVGSWGTTGRGMSQEAKRYLDDYLFDPENVDRYLEKDQAVAKARGMGGPEAHRWSTSAAYEEGAPPAPSKAPQGWKSLDSTAVDDTLDPPKLTAEDGEELMDEWGSYPPGSVIYNKTAGHYWVKGDEDWYAQADDFKDEADAVLHAKKFLTHSFGQGAQGPSTGASSTYPNAGGHFTPEEQAYGAATIQTTEGFKQVHDLYPPGTVLYNEETGKYHVTTGHGAENTLSFHSPTKEEALHEAYQLKNGKWNTADFAKDPDYVEVPMEDQPWIGGAGATGPSAAPEATPAAQKPWLSKPEEPPVSYPTGDEPYLTKIVTSDPLTLGASEVAFNETKGAYQINVGTYSPHILTYDTYEKAVNALKMKAEAIGGELGTPPEKDANFQANLDTMKANVPASTPAGEDLDYDTYITSPGAFDPQHIAQFQVGEIAKLEDGSPGETYYVKTGMNDYHVVKSLQEAHQIKQQALDEEAALEAAALSLFGEQPTFQKAQQAEEYKNLWKGGKPAEAPSGPDWSKPVTVPKGQGLGQTFDEMPPGGVLYDDASGSYVIKEANGNPASFMTEMAAVDSAKKVPDSPLNQGKPGLLQKLGAAAKTVFGGDEAGVANLGIVKKGYRDEDFNGKKLEFVREDAEGYGDKGWRAYLDGVPQTETPQRTIADARKIVEANQRAEDFAAMEEPAPKQRVRNRAVAAAARRAAAVPGATYPRQIGAESSPEATPPRIDRGVHEGGPLGPENRIAPAEGTGLDTSGPLPTADEIVARGPITGNEAADYASRRMAAARMLQRFANSIPEGHPAKAGVQQTAARDMQAAGEDIQRVREHAQGQGAQAKDELAERNRIGKLKATREAREAADQEAMDAALARMAEEDPEGKAAEVVEASTAVENAKTPKQAEAAAKQMTDAVTPPRPAETRDLDGNPVKPPATPPRRTPVRAGAKAGAAAGAKAGAKAGAAAAAPGTAPAPPGTTTPKTPKTPKTPTPPTPTTPTPQPRQAGKMAGANWWLNEQGRLRPLGELESQLRDDADFEHGEWQKLQKAIKSTTDQTEHAKATLAYRQAMGERFNAKLSAMSGMSQSDILNLASNPTPLGDKVRELIDKGGLARDIESSQEHLVGDVLGNIARANLIGANPVTMARNATGGAASLLLHPLEALGASGLSKLTEKAYRKKGLDDRLEKRYGREATMLIKGYGKALSASLVNAQEALQKGNQYTARGYADELEWQRKNPDAKVGKFARKMTDKLLAPLTATDAFFRTLTQGGELMRQSYRGMRDRGMSDAEIDREMVGLLQGSRDQFVNRFTEQFADSLSKGVQGEVDYRAFTQSLDEPGRALQNVQRIKGIGNLIMPFVSTPYNATKFDLERSPVGLAKTLWDMQQAGKPGDINTKTLTQDTKGAATSGEMADRLTRNMIGTTVFGTILGGSLAGIFDLNGSLPDSQRERDEWEAEGRRPYSIGMGDRYVSFQDLPGLNAPLIQAALIKDIITRGGMEDAALPVEITKGILESIRALAARPMAGGALDVAQAVMNPSRASDSVAQSMLNPLLPLSGVSRVVTTAGDPMQRERPVAPWENPGETIARAYNPEVLPERTDVVGNPLENWNYGLAGFNPIRTSANTGFSPPTKYFTSSRAADDIAVERSVDKVNAWKKDPVNNPQPETQDFINASLASAMVNTYGEQLKKTERSRLDLETASRKRGE